MRVLPPGLLAAAVVAASLTLPASPAGAAGDLTPERTHRLSLAEARARIPIAVGRPDDGRHTRIEAVDRSGRALATGQGVTRELGAKQRRNQLAAAPHVLSATPLSVWVVTYRSGCTTPTTDQDTALRRAVATWSRAVASSVPIALEACFTTLGQGELGGASPRGFQSFGGVYFPDALANALTGSDGAPGEPDVLADFSTAPGLFYYGASPTGIGAACPSGCYDFESVALHELGHGLGFVGSLDSNGSTATYGIDSSDRTPFVYDVFAETSAGAPVLAYPWGSTALHNVVTSNSVYWNGPEGSGADRGREPRLYTPLSWLDESSFSHLSDTSYPDNDADSLMTPFAEANDVNRDPGEVVLGMFRDMGWVTPALPGLRYVPLNGPVPVLSWGPVGNGAMKDVNIAGGYGVPRTAAAVVLNLMQTATTASSNSQLFAYARPRLAPSPPPARVPNLVTAATYTKDALATVPLAGGGVRFRNVGGTARNYASVVGYFVPTGGTPYVPATPRRVIDTRTGLGTARVPITTSARQVRISGVPATAVAVALNVTGLTSSNTSMLQVYSSDLSLPAAGNVHLKIGQSATNLVIAKLGANDAIKLRTTVGSVHVTADLAGWFDASGKSLYRPTLPQRVAAGAFGVGVRDTRVLGVEQGFGVPGNATAFVLSTIASYPTKTSFLATYGRATFPYITTLTVMAGRTGSAPTMTRNTDGVVRTRNTAGSSTLSLDLFGYYAP